MFEDRKSSTYSSMNKKHPVGKQTKQTQKQTFILLALKS